MLIVSTTKTVRRYIDRSYSWLRKKRGGQNRTAQWSRKGKSKNLDSKIFLFHNSTVFVFESLEEVSKASKHYWNSTCIRTLFTSEVLSQLNLIDWSTSKKAFSVLNHCALCRQAKTWDPSSSYFDLARPQYGQCKFEQSCGRLHCT